MWNLHINRRFCLDGRTHAQTGKWRCDNFLLHNNPYFPRNIAITNFLVSNTCKIRFHDVIYRTVRMFTSWRHPTQKLQNMTRLVCFGPLFFNSVRLIQLCDKTNLTFVDCWDEILLNSSWKTKGSLNNIFQDTFNKILSQQLTDDRSYMSRSPQSGLDRKKKEQNFELCGKTFLDKCELPKLLPAIFFFHWLSTGTAYGLHFSWQRAKHS